MRFTPTRSVPLLSLATALSMTLAASPANSTSFTPSCFASYGSPGLTVADFNNDGNVDVAISPGTAAGAGFTVQPLINVYLGDGLGGFSFASQVTTAFEFIYLSAADVNNDGKQDLINSGDYTGPPSINLGNGDGTFQAAQTVPTAGVDGLAMADMNQDGFVDIVSGEDKDLLVTLNQGNGSFGAATSYRVGAYLRGVTTADINGDGLRDVAALALTNNGNPVVAVFLNKGGGTLGKVNKSNMPAGSGYGGRHVDLADFNGDGKLDVAVTRLQGGGINVAFGNGAGSFGSSVNYPMPGNTNHLSVGDINGDGKLDIAAANEGVNPNSPTGTVTVLYGNGSGSFTVGNVVPCDFGLGIALVDANEDSHLDIIEDSCVLLNSGTLATAPATRIGTMRVAPSELIASFSPNPSHGHGVLGFSLPKEGTVSIHLYDIRGRRVHTLANGVWMNAGPHSMDVDHRAAGLTSGIYFYRIETQAGRKSGRIVIAND
jgi:FG-GAP-like repeat